MYDKKNKCGGKNKLKKSYKKQKGGVKLSDLPKDLEKMVKKYKNEMEDVMRNKLLDMELILNEIGELVPILKESLGQWGELSLEDIHRSLNKIEKYINNLEELIEDYVKEGGKKTDINKYKKAIKKIKKFVLNQRNENIEYFYELWQNYQNQEDGLNEDDEDDQIKLYEIQQAKALYQGLANEHAKKLLKNGGEREKKYLSHFDIDFIDISNMKGGKKRKMKKPKGYKKQKGGVKLSDLPKDLENMVLDYKKNMDKNATEISVKIKMKGYKDLNIVVDKNSKVYDIKSIISKKRKLNSPDIHIFFKGKKLVPRYSLDDYSIKDDSVLKLEYNGPKPKKSPQKSKKSPPKKSKNNKEKTYFEMIMSSIF